MSEERQEITTQGRSGVPSEGEMPGNWEDDVDDILKRAGSLGKKKRRHWLESLRRRKQRPPSEIEAANRRWVRFHGYVRDAPECLESKQEARRRRVRSAKSGSRKLVIPIMAIVITGLAVLLAVPDLRERLVAELGLQVPIPAAIPAAPPLAPTDVPVAAPVESPSDDLSDLPVADPARIPALGPEAAQPLARPSDVELITRSQKHLVQVVHADGRGSGILLGQNSLVLTNYHVIEGAESFSATGSDGTIAALQLLTFDADRDLALLQAQSPMPELPPVVWASDESTSLGEPLIVLGFPIHDESITVTRGIVSGFPVIRGQPMVQTDAALNPGVSGGAAFAADGSIVGIAVSGYEAAENFGFLIPASQVVLRLDEWLTQLAEGTLRLPATPPVGGGVPTESPTITPISIWLDAWSEFVLLRNDYVDRANKINDSVSASTNPPNYFIEEYRGLRNWLIEDGPLSFVTSAGIPELLEADGLNNRIAKWAENEAEKLRLYIHHLETASAVSFEQAQNLFDQNLLDWERIWDEVEAMRQGWREL